jgi:hypothetical protein
MHRTVLISNIIKILFVNMSVVVVFRDELSVSAEIGPMQASLTKITMPLVNGPHGVLSCFVGVAIPTRALLVWVVQNHESHGEAPLVAWA